MKTVSAQHVREKAEEVASLMKTLSHPNRLLIVCDLLENEKSVSDIETSTGVRQPVLSRELAQLREKGLVATRRESKVVFYRIVDAQLQAFMLILCRAWQNGASNLEWAKSPSTNTNATQEAGFPSVHGRRVRIKPDPYRTD